MTSKHVAMVVPEMLPVPSVQGGAVEHWVDEVSRRLCAGGHRLSVVSRPAGVAGADGIRYIGIPWTRAERLFHRLKEHLGHGNPLRHLAKIQNVWAYGLRVARAVAEADVVYLHNEPNILMFLRKRAGQRIVLHMHNDHLSVRLFHSFYRRCLSKVDQIICVSDYIRRRAVESFPEYAEKFCVVLNATDPDVFRPYGDEAYAALKDVLTFEAGCQYLLYVGRLMPLKGVHVLIESFREIHSRRPETRLIITGSSFFCGAVKTPYQAQLIQLAAPMAEAIVFTGFLPHAQLKYLYSAADLVVVPSTWGEPFGLVVVEAMSAGTCLVASSVGGIPEIIEDGETGFLVPPDDAEALAEVVCCALADSLRKAEIEVRARAKAELDYCWERLVVEVSAVFEELQ